MKVDVTPENLEFFQCFSSETRLRIIDLIREEPRNIGELAEIIGVSSTIIARHVNMLEKSGIIGCNNIPGKRGIQKQCELILDEATINFNLTSREQRTETLSIPIGHYNDYAINPTCGMASAHKIIGIVDDTRHFSNPEHFDSSILWFQEGWVSYKIPSYLFSPKDTFIEISLEMCSEYPHYKTDHPSDIYFYINDICLGRWVSPGDFGDRRGTYTPEWWTLGTQYGLLKRLRITKEATFIDGEQISSITIDDLLPFTKEDLNFKIASPKETENNGGLTLFGRYFGNYQQDITILVGKS